MAAILTLCFFVSTPNIASESIGRFAGECSRWFQMSSEVQYLVRFGAQSRMLYVLLRFAVSLVEREHSDWVKTLTHSTAPFSTEMVAS